MSVDDALSWLLNRFEMSVGDAAAVHNTELWIKLDRLEETLRFLALTNVDVADGYRRQVGNEILRMRAASGRLVEAASAAEKGGRS
jgi:hypothetical protein